MKVSRILGTGSYLPPKVWKNDDLRSLMETSDEWIVQRTGIKQRHWVDQDSNACTSDLAVEAAQRALASAGVDKSEIDRSIRATRSPDHEFTGTACFFQAKMEMPGIPASETRAMRAPA